MNHGTDFIPGWLHHRLNDRAIAARARAIAAARPVTPEHQAEWLTHAIRCIDLTTLAGDDTAGRVRRLCAKARQPLRPQLLQALGLKALHTGAVCVYPAMVPHAVAALDGALPVASVATGFPAGLMPLDLRLAEIRYCVEQGAAEIDIVISREAALTGDWPRLYDETRAMRDACGPARMKAILATGELGDATTIYRAAMVAMQGGADFIKTSTGKEPVNATLPVSLVMLRALRDYQDQTGQQVGFKPAGGLRTWHDALIWLSLIEQELGARHMQPDLFRIGASSLLGALEARLEELTFGAAPDPRSMAMG
ncbi:MAG: deoxyribose-phosphate aldolase [Paracoccus sp. (in: a-proteobacteria)]|uniref:deoxyribose-phosphate aldolase n=1 Tax=Paracoccus sp. TaxID=267 RepID=UPI0026DF4320|nr:deoxyribose-phosphate aldolase [Paracoccus sp. (in: a-proteobacteria)]MDO5620761.1 deoxyribose-phosphate aldolase [Paracoccus sp. (in: a-proteobacteria)]